MKRIPALHTGNLDPLPPLSTQLVEELNKSVPARCVRLGETEIEAHRYAAKRELIDYLLARMESSHSADPTKPVL